MADDRTMKRFMARHVAFDEFRRRQVDTWGGRAIPESEHLMVLEDYLDVSLRRRENSYPLFKLQLELLADVVLAERSIAAYKQKITETEQKPSGEAKDSELDGLNAQLEMFKRVRRALRDIGDGIAWRLLGYDRAALTALAKYPRKPHINLEGLMAEMGVFGEEYNRPGGRLAVLNDLTHYLKKADVTVRVDESTFEFVEVKSSLTKSGTLKRQRANLEETLRLLSEGQGEQGEDAVSIRELSVVPSSHMKPVAALIREAEMTGSACGAIGEHLVVGFIDWPTALTLDPEIVMSKWERGRSLAERWRERGDVVYKGVGTDRYHEVRNVAPYSIYRLPAAQRVKLMTGALFTVSWLDVSAALRYVESRGWTLLRVPAGHATSGDTVDLETLRAAAAVIVKKGSFTCHVPGTWLGRIAYEYLAPRTIVEALEAMRTARPHLAETTFPSFAGESQQWD